MSKKDIKLSEYINDINFNTTSADIIIYPDNIKEPIVRYDGEFDIKEMFHRASINQKVNNSSINIISNRRGNNVIQINGKTYRVQGSKISIHSNNNITIINGRVINNAECDNYPTENIRSNQVELIVPKDKSDLLIKATAISGNITLENLILSRLIATTTSGNITLNDIDILLSNLKSISGNISAEIIESILNYRTILHSVSGRTIEDSIETTSPTILQEKHKLEARSTSGNVKILFKGKR